MDVAKARMLASALWSAATAVGVLAVWLCVSLANEYGLSPNHGLVADLSSGALTLALPAGLIVGGLAYAGWRVWRRAR